MKITEPETILVTGVAGNAATEVVNQLLTVDQSLKIRAAVHSVKNLNKISGDGIEGVQIDYDKRDTLAAALKGVDKVFLVTPESPNTPEYVSNLVNEAKKASVSHIVRLSALGANLDSVVTSLRLHRQGEKIIEESEIPFTFLRPGEFMQNFINFFPKRSRNMVHFTYQLEIQKFRLLMFVISQQLE
jgi:uncharacterized protein YbjT (DUF2867 family)